MTRYAETTTVTADRSRGEIERTLTRYGATAFMYGWEATRAVVQFRMADLIVRFELPMPDPTDPEFTNHKRGRRTPEAAATRYEQATRQRWRALALVVKAKLEAVDAGIATFEEEFLAHIVLPDGTRVADQALPAVAEAYETGRVPRLLPPPGSTR